MENHYNCIYMYTNKINGKRYIGKAEDFLRRKKQHIKSSYNKKANDYNVPFHRAIRKYGIENFEATILKENLTEDEVNYWEDYYIETFDLYAKNGKGYNIAKGGTGGNLIEGKTEEERKEIRQKISEAMKGKTGENHPRSVKISQYDKQGNLIKVFNSAHDIESELGINNSNIITCCKWYDCGENLEEWHKIRKGYPVKTAGGYIFRYAEE